MNETELEKLQLIVTMMIDYSYDAERHVKEAEYEALRARDAITELRNYADRINNFLENRAVGQELYDMNTDRQWVMDNIEAVWDVYHPDHKDVWDRIQVYNEYAGRHSVEYKDIIMNNWADSDINEALGYEFRELDYSDTSAWDFHCERIFEKNVERISKWNSEFYDYINKELEQYKEKK